MTMLTITKQQARRFLLFHQGLAGEEEFQGKSGILDFIRRVGCIQFDPLDVVGKNPELVLQSRIKGFRREMLSELLYSDRSLADYWDKNVSIIPLEDSPFLQRYSRSYRDWCEAQSETVEQVKKQIISRGPLCSGDLPHDEKVDWPWGPTRLSRAVLESMFYAGMLVIHHKEGTRKFYDLAERFIPETLLSAQDPNRSEEEYYAWHVLRRIGSVGLLWNRPSDAWLGIAGLKSLERSSAFSLLLKRNQIVEIHVEGIRDSLYLRSCDMGTLERVVAGEQVNERASILAPLDNLLWDRKLVFELSGFEYRWEVYKPVRERKFGYYVLPVLFGDSLVARFEPEKQRGDAPFSIKNWWWEVDVVPDERMKKILLECMENFAKFLGATFEKDSQYQNFGRDIK